MRLINGDKLYNVIQDFPAMYEEAREMKEDVLLEISETPSIDAVVVTRCKDCKHMAGALLNDKGFLICPASGMEITPDDFCSYGEPKEG